MSYLGALEGQLQALPVRPRLLLQNRGCTQLGSCRTCLMALWWGVPSPCMGSCTLCHEACIFYHKPLRCCVPQVALAAAVRLRCR